MKAAIIGTSLISEIHFREIAKHNFNEIYIISRSKKNAERKRDKERSNSCSTSMVFLRIL